jgi:hypothetical protein
MNDFICPKCNQPGFASIYLSMCTACANAERGGDALHVDIWYPRTDNPIKAIEVGLMDVRAADDIRIEYDFVRDGWVIKQAQVFEWGADKEICDPQWKEVAFVEAWASEIIK